MDICLLSVVRILLFFLRAQLCRISHICAEVGLIYLVRGQCRLYAQPQNTFSGFHRRQTSSFLSSTLEASNESVEGEYGANAKTHIANIGKTVDSITRPIFLASFIINASHLLMCNHNL
mgnify:CR=1 FL=1